MNQQKTNNIAKNNNQILSIDKLFLKRIEELDIEEQKMLLALYKEIKVEKR